MTRTPKKLGRRTRTRNPRGTLQPIRNDAKNGILSYITLADFWSSSKLSCMAFHFLYQTSPQISGRCPQTQSELDPSDGWDDPVDEIHSYVTGGTFWSFKKAVCYLTNERSFLQQSEKATKANFGYKQAKRRGHIEIVLVGRELYTDRGSTWS